MEKVTHLQIFSSTILDGNMNTNAKFFEPGLTKEQIRAQFNQHRIQLGKQYGFDGMHILTPIQKVLPSLDGLSKEAAEQAMKTYESMYPDGSYVRITRERLEQVTDLYDLDIYSDILMIGKELPGIVLAYPVADCPVVLVEDTKQGVVSMAHCGAEYIDRGLPGQMVDSLREEVDSKPCDIRVFIGPHIQKESYIYDGFPKFIRHPDAWGSCITEFRGMIHIDMTSAILKQMALRGISMEKIECSSIDTYRDARYYSHRASSVLQEPEGRFYTGCFYQEEEKVMCKNR